MDTKILLENGTNELEVLEFTIAGNSYGINVAKIKEIINYQPVTAVPNAMSKNKSGIREAVEKAIASTLSVP